MSDSVPLLAKLANMKPAVYKHRIPKGLVVCWQTSLEEQEVQDSFTTGDLRG